MKNLIFVFLFFMLVWISYLVLKRIGFFESYRASRLYQAKAHKALVFILKVYLLPLIRKKRNKTSPDFLKKKLYWFLSVLYFSIFSLFLVLLLFFYFEKASYTKVNTGNLEIVEGTVTDFFTVAIPTRHFIVIEHAEGISKDIQYFTEISIDEMLLGKFIELHYVSTLLGGNELISIYMDNVQIVPIKEEVDRRSSHINTMFNWIMAILFVVIPVPWIRYKKYGLISFIY